MEELIPGGVNSGGVQGVCLPPARECGARRPAGLPPVVVVSHVADGPAVRRATAGGDYIIVDVTPNC